MKRILTTFCFDHDSLSNTVIAEIIEKTVFFSPTSIQSNVFLNLGGKYRGNFHIDKIRDSMDPIKSLDLTTELGLKGPSFHVGYIANWKMKMVYWKLPQQSNIKDELLHELTDAKGFNIGYQTDSEYSFWQSADSMNTYEVKNRSYDHLPIIKHPVTGRLMVDISNNPGRRSLFPGMWLQVAQKMWFGNGSFTYFDKKEIMEYRNADSIIELENGTVFVELYDDPFASEKEVNQKKQIEFRELLGIDTLERNAHEIALQTDDPVLNIDIGQFTHGGDRLITVFTDGRGIPVNKSKAAKRFIREIDSKGKTLWQMEELM